MFVRVAACIVAALLFVAPEASRSVSPARADVEAAATVVSPVITADANTAVVPAVDVQSPEPLAALPHLAALDPDAAPRRAPLPGEPFSAATMPWFSGDVFDKWRNVAAQMRAEDDVLAHCRDDAADCPPAAQKFLAIVAAGRAQSGRARIGAINRAVNLAIRETSDLAQWGVVEHWSPPLETLATGRGDCEDYAIAKFAALIAAGLAPEDVRLVVVHDTVADDGHAVAAARVDGHWLILDNRWLALAEDSDLPRLAPQFVIGRTGVRAYLRPLPGAVASAS
jgi:predicted transglutaminase-like cysteine proteinase